MKEAIRQPLNRMSERRGEDRAAFVVATLALLLLAVPWPLQAATAGKIGFIDLKRIESQSVVGQEAAKQLRAEQAEEQGEQKALDNEADALRQAASKLGPEERKQKEEALRGKVETLKQRQAERTKDKQAKAKERRGGQDLRRKIHDAVQAYAKEQGFVAIFTKGRGIFYGDEQIDITDAVIERLNKRNPQGEGGDTPPPKR